MIPATGDTADTPESGRREDKLRVRQDAVRNGGGRARPAKGKPAELERKEVEKNMPADPDPDDPASP